MKLFTIIIPMIFCILQETVGDWRSDLHDNFIETMKLYTRNYETDLKTNFNIGLATGGKKRKCLDETSNKYKKILIEYQKSVACCVSTPYDTKDKSLKCLETVETETTGRASIGHSMAKSCLEQIQNEQKRTGFYF